MKRLLWLWLLLWPLPALASPLQGQLEKLVRRYPEWKIGVAVWLIRGEAAPEKVEVQADQPLALASVFKVPVLVELARQVQAKRGDLQLSSGLAITEAEKCIGSGKLLHQPNGTVVRVDRLIELMETISDNTATDMLFHRIGIGSVNRMLAEVGCKNSDVALTNRASWLISLGQSSDFRSLSPEQIAAKWRKLSPEGRRAAAERAEQENLKLSLRKFQQLEDASDQNQTHEQNVLVATTVDNLSSASDLALLLTQLYQEKLLNHQLTQFCLGVLGRQRFNTRIPRDLPRGTRVYHKTGTIAGVVNDIGIIEVPDQGAVAVAVLISQVGKGEDARADQLIGKIARLAYDELNR